MIKMIDIGIKKATAFCMSGKITESDMSLVLSDAKTKIDLYGKIVIYEEIQSFKGIELSAIVDEFKYLFNVGISNIKKAAVVTDKGWVQKIVKIEDKIFKNIEMKCFSIEEKKLAIEFLTYCVDPKEINAEYIKIGGVDTILC
ncbi:MAG: STAS/SEC14 domain-containing protein [Deltaproteobacteria bacterium]|nr:STAS/SEC14 domain-containing protein [Deltaproteobacteria bacterium]